LAGIRVPRVGPGRPRTRPEHPVADRRRGRAGGRPCGFDSARYRRRNAVERGWNKLKQWRGIATRYDKTAADFRGGIQLVVLLTWTPRDSGDTA
jgi:transposase